MGRHRSVRNDSGELPLGSFGTDSLYGSHKIHPLSGDQSDAVTVHAERLLLSSNQDEETCFTRSEALWVSLLVISFKDSMLIKDLFE